MKKVIYYSKKEIWPILMIAFMMSFITACSNDDNPAPESKTTDLSSILKQYVNNTVINTYHNLADASIDLETACINLQKDKSDAQVKAADAAWIKARKFWEQSEAFLYGPATIRGIDPHIDSWPLDKQNLDDLLASESIMSKFDANYATNNLTSGLLGFHALEYVIFSEGGARSASTITDNELKFAVGVAGDLKLQCIILEAAWAGHDKVTSAKQKILDDAEVSFDIVWGDNIIHAGEAGSTFKTQKDAIVEILQGEKGCRGIANEVGNTKITDPVNSGNVLDVESWYSWNSKEDFQDNIRGIENSFLGGVSDSRDSKLSIYSYLYSLDPTLADKLKASVVSTIGEDGKSGIGTLIYPFRNHLSKVETQAAIDACNNLVSILDEASSLIQKQQ